MLGTRMMTKPVRDQFADTMLDIGREDDKLVVLVGDITHFKLQPFAQACPGRFYNVGICEPTIVSMAAGLAKSGLVPVAHTIAPFLLERSYEQIKLDFCYHKLPGNLVTVGGAFDYSNLGCTHHCYSDFALLKLLPNTDVLYPATALEFDSLFRQAYRNDRLSLFRIPAHQHTAEFRPEDIVYGQNVVVRTGSNITLIATGPQLRTAIAASPILVQQGWDPEIIYVHTIRPLSQETIYRSVDKTRRVVVIEEHSWTGGLSDDVLRLTRPIDRVQFASLSIPDRFVRSYGGYDQLCAEIGLCPEGLVAKVKSSFSR